MEDMTPCSKDREIFQRVWQRVMEGRCDELSPIQPDGDVGEGDVSCACLEELLLAGGGSPALRQPDQPVEEAPVEEPPMEEAPAMEPRPSQDQAQSLPPAEGPHRDSDMPRLWEEPTQTDDRTARLRRHVLEALEGWQMYRHLARRARGTDARVLNAMAGELHREARKLSASYFLLTGLRYWPTETLGAPAIPSYWGALRTRHQAEQRQENAYRLAADDWEDPDLLALYNELAEGCQGRCRKLRSLLEEGIT